MEVETAVSVVVRRGPKPPTATVVPMGVVHREVANTQGMGKGVGGLRAYLGSY
jgi:hypothetical protein